MTVPGIHIDSATDYEAGDPLEVGCEPAKVADLVERAQREIDSGLLPSCQIALARNGRLVVDRTFGAADPASRYVVFSCTKVLMAGAVWLAIGEGHVSRETCVADIVPEFGTNGKDAVTVEQLLTHTSGFPTAPFAPADWNDHRQRLARFSQWRLNWEPGSRFEYHPTSAHWALAEVLERVTGTDFRAFAHDSVTAPLGINTLRLGVSPTHQDGIVDLVPVGEPPTPEEVEAATGIAGLDMAAVADIAEEELLGFNAPDNRRVGVPGAGAVGRAADLAMLLQAMMENPGGLWNPEVLRAGTAEVLCDFVDPMVGVPSNRTLGLLLAGDDGCSAMRGFGRTVSAAAFGHMGAGGQVAWADPSSGLSFAYLTNGLDRDPIRMGRRGSSLANRAGVCASPA